MDLIQARRRLLTLRKKKKLLPEEYTQVQYIGAKNNTPYIDTGIYLTDELETEIHYYNDKVEGFLFGARKAMSSAPYCNFNITKDSGAICRFDYGNLKLNGNDRFIGYHDGEYLFSFHDRIATLENCVTGNQASRSMSSSKFTAYTNYSILLFAAKTGSTVSLGEVAGNLYIYSAKFWINKELVRDFIPCVRNIDNIAGMYDLITKQFFSSVNSDLFVTENTI